MLPQGIFQGLDFFRGFSLDEISELTAGAKHIVHKHKDVVFAAGDPADHFGLVVQGCYKLSRVRKQETLLSFATRNDPIGLLLMAQPQAIYPINVQSLGVSQFLRLPRSTYLECWVRIPEIVKRSQSALMHRCLGFHADRGLQHLSLEKRVAGFLLRCLERYAEENTAALKFPLSRREVSDAVGAQVESVIRVMSHWEKSGIISTRAQHIEILRPADLAEVENSAEGVLFDT